MAKISIANEKLHIFFSLFSACKINIEPHKMHSFHWKNKGFTKRQWQAATTAKKNWHCVVRMIDRCRLKKDRKQVLLFIKWARRKTTRSHDNRIQFLVDFISIHDDISVRFLCVALIVYTRERASERPRETTTVACGWKVVDQVLNCRWQWQPSTSWLRWIDKML